MADDTSTGHRILDEAIRILQEIASRLDGSRVEEIKTKLEAVAVNIDELKAWLDTRPKATPAS